MFGSRESPQQSAHAPRREARSRAARRATASSVRLRRSVRAHQREIAIPVGELAIDRDRVPRRRLAEEVEPERAPVERVDVVPASRRRSTRCARAAPAAGVVDPAEDVVRRHLGRHLAVDRVHHVEGAAERRSGSRSSQRTGGTGTSAAGEARHHLVLAPEVVLGEDEEVVRLEARDEALVRAAPPVAVLDVEEEGLVRDARLGRAERRDARARVRPAACGAARRPVPWRTRSRSRWRPSTAAARQRSAVRSAAAASATACLPWSSRAPMPKKPWIMPS